MRTTFRGIAARGLKAWIVLALLLPMLPMTRGVFRMTESERRSINNQRKQQHVQRPQHRG